MLAIGPFCLFYLTTLLTTFKLAFKLAFTLVALNLAESHQMDTDSRPCPSVPFLASHREASATRTSLLG